MNRTVFLSDLTSHSYGSRTPSAPAMEASQHLLDGAATPPNLGVSRTVLLAGPITERKSAGRKQRTYRPTSLKGEPSRPGNSFTPSESAATVDAPQLLRYPVDRKTLLEEIDARVEARICSQQPGSGPASFLRLLAKSRRAAGKRKERSGGAE